MKLAVVECGGEVFVSAQIGRRLVRTPWTTIGDVLASGTDAWAPMADLAADVGPVDRWLPPLPDRAQVIGVGANYGDHRREGGIAATLSEPVFFPILWGALIGHGEQIEIPFPDTQLDYELELGVMVGRTMQNVSAQEAMDYVFGYTIVNDVTARDVMIRERLQIMLAKSCDTFLPVGPFLVTAEEVPNPQALRLITKVNGELRQDGTTADMLVPVAGLLATLSQTVTLHPGDLVVTGTPAGVGSHMNPPSFLAAGDRIEMMIDNIGTLRNTVGRRGSGCLPH